MPRPHFIVAVYRIDRDFATGVIAPQPCELLTDVFDERAVVADEHDEVGIGSVCQGVHLSIGVGQCEIGRLRPEGQHL